ncbi:MAG: hypothetical protein JST68_15295 [Bacteroidetes bacterium]|nr:hypothetical protein [Bacteroidota bacterium]
MKAQFLLSALLTLGISAAQAQTAANWNFNSTMSGTAGSNISAANAALGSAIPTPAFNGGGEFYGEDGWPAGAVNPNAYLQFSLSPSSGYYLVLNNVSLVMRRSNTGSPQGSGPNNWVLRSSLDGYTADLASGSMTYNYATYTVSLPSAFQSLSSGVTFRVYGYNMTINSGGNSRFVFDNISIQGQSINTLLAQQSVSLTAKAAPSSVDLQWTSQGLAEGTRFSIDRSIDGTHFTTIAQSFGGTSYTDAALPSAARIFYRIAAEQPDGVIVHSTIVSLALENQQAHALAIRSLAVSGDNIKALLHLVESGSYRLSIWSQDGKMLYATSISATAGDQVADIPAGHYPRGLYIFSLTKNGINTSRQFLY